MPNVSHQDCLKSSRESRIQELILRTEHDPATGSSHTLLSKDPQAVDERWCQQCSNSQAPIHRQLRERLYNSKGRLALTSGEKTASLDDELESLLVGGTWNQSQCHQAPLPMLILDYTCKYLDPALRGAGHAASWPRHQRKKQWPGKAWVSWSRQYLGLGDTALGAKYPVFRGT